ncbi:hypothetical protein TRIATDRAFT_81043 [Trichoderma atroviride IMI 206040]|uniref:Uncharacterized protein n=1 Tax=Hypocrea atroviridis (strain ATCC 20476 / IMI 206040) TaxID=452589 RepID=G9NNM4_HYPAI|nr:uncharacterized protein TRIATDRAFT_81043 [Trichoderma atroviride IMI 206040]EHK47668.1 hypothetical protein TRIATDRAFT_81043 [Trichoderma atroviride IMI 206040]
MTTFKNHEEILETAFRDPQNTAINLEPSNVNRVIKSGAYDADPNIHYTKTQLWDMEYNKAYNPEKYLRHILRPGSVRIFNVQKDGPRETFVRVSDQVTWVDPSKYSTVIEQVLIDNERQRAFFIGVPEVEDPEGKKIVSGDQVLFHVEHSAAGAEDEPLNIWRIVHLDKDEDGKIKEAFAKMGAAPYLREFNEVYIREDLGKKLIRI